MTADRDALRHAAQHLHPDLLAVWTLKHIQGYGRRKGASFLGITAEAWRWRLERAEAILAQETDRKEVA